MDQKLIDLYDEYTHESLDRREFLRRLSILTGSTAAAIALLPLKKTMPKPKLFQRMIPASMRSI